MFWQENIMAFKFNRPKHCLIQLIILFSLITTLAGCAGSLKDLKFSLAKKEPKKEKEVVYNLVKVPEPKNVHNEGSLWQDDSALSGLFISQKARKTGDIVTVNIVEASSASNQAGTQTDRASSLSGGIDTIFGFENEFNSDDKYKNIRKYFNPFSAAGAATIQGSMGSEFDGSGTTTRSGNLSAYITARVTTVMPNGNLQITGTREVEINNEKLIITLTGVIRPRDISPENVILSTYISDAKITYSGTGVIDDRQRPGWLANLINAIWPF
jgi:flagellar L-ring protein precursor FlgH